MSDDQQPDQAIDFLIKRAEYSARQAGLHRKGNEFGKAIALYRDAYKILEKALENRPDDFIIKKKMDEVKAQFDEARAAYQEQPQATEEPTAIAEDMAPQEEIVPEFPAEAAVEEPVVEEEKPYPKKKSGGKKKK